MTHAHNANLATHGYCHLQAPLSDEALAIINREFAVLNQQASAILHDISQQNLSYAEYYRQGKATFITVPEAEHPTQTCRFEYIQANSAIMREQLIPFCAAQIYRHTGQKVRLFKDKCNLKSPGGGAFSAHQDIPAYIDFGPKIHITAAVFLDEATAENGALEMATNYLSLQGEGIECIDTPLGCYPLLATYQGGSNNGRIVKHLEEQLQWQPVYAKAGDIILFNSYIPHRSAINCSNATRRAFFFTFNLLSDGELYETYYQTKRADFGNLRFHVATPTTHNGLPLNT